MREKGAQIRDYLERGSMISRYKATDQYTGFEKDSYPEERWYNEVLKTTVQNVDEKDSL